MGEKGQENIRPDYGLYHICIKDLFIEETDEDHE